MRVLARSAAWLSLPVLAGLLAGGPPAAAHPGGLDGSWAVVIKALNWPGGPFRNWYRALGRFTEEGGLVQPLTDPYKEKQ